MNLSSRIKITLDVLADNARKSLASLKKDILEAEGATAKLKAGFKGAGTFINQNAAAITAAGLAIGGGLFKMTQGVAETDAAFSSLNQIAGEAIGKDVAGWAENGVKAFGMSDRAMFTHSKNLANIADSVDMTEAEMRTFIETHLKMAADYAAFADTNPDQVMQDMRSAYSGSTETLQKYGVFANEANLKTAIFNETGKKITGTLTAQERTLGINLLLKEKHASIDGQWARESGELAGQQAQFKANLTNVSDAIARGALPMMTAMTGAASDVFAAIDDLPGPLKSIAGLLAGLGSGGLLATVALVKIVSGLAKAKAAFIVLRTAMIGHPLIAIGSVLAGAAAAFGIFGRGSDEAGQKVDELADKLRETNDELSTFTDYAIELASGNEHLRKSMAAAGLTTDDLTEAINGSKEEAGQFTAALLEGADAAGLDGTAQLGLAAQIENSRKVTEAAKRKRDEMNAVTAEGTTAIGKASAAERDYIAWLEKRSGEVTEATATVGRASDAERDYVGWLEKRGDEADETREAEDALREATERATEARRAAVDASFAVRAAERDYRSALDETLAVLFDAESTQDDRNEAIDRGTQAAIRLADEEVRLRQETDTANGIVRDAEYYQGLWNDSMARAAESSTVPQVRQQIQDVLDKLNELDGKSVLAHIVVNTQRTGAHLPGTDFAVAGGTSGHPGGVSIVGEDGPEILKIPRGSEVIPAGPTRKLRHTGNTAGRSTDGGNTYINVPMGYRPADIARLDRLYRRRNGL